MSKNELKELLKDNTFDDKHTIDASALFNIYSFVDVKLQMDRNTFDYYYEIDVDDLLKSRIPKDEYEVLKTQGWFYGENDKLKIFLTI